MKDVALVLSSGGPRGFAYIGAIEELEARGYRITSVAGCSMGALIGGMYAAGKLPEVKEWLFSLDNWKVLKLMDLSISKNHVVKGDKVMDALKAIVPPVGIEELSIPYKAIATDLYTGEEVVFSRGNLYEAVRASISIPTLFRPAKVGLRTLIDGGLCNTLPLNRVDRNGHDIVVAFDVNDVDEDAIRKMIVDEADSKAVRKKEEEERKEENKAVIESIMHNDSLSLMDKFKLAAMQGQKIFHQAFEKDGKEEKESLDFDPEDNYYTLLTRSFSLMNHANARIMASFCPCDVMVRMPFYAFGALTDYAKAEEISETGRMLMREALDRYENGEAR